MATEDSRLTTTVTSALGWGPPEVILKGRISAQVVYLEAIPRGTGRGWASETGEGRRTTQCALISRSPLSANGAQSRQGPLGDGEEQGSELSQPGGKDMGVFTHQFPYIIG